MWLLRRVRVIGPSMEPSVRNGQTWLCTMGRVRPGHVVVFREPGRPELLSTKRVIRRQGHGWWVEGDNPAASRDSRNFGPVAPAEIRGVLRWRI
jgi:nickel-type superoxide dismutase maturation protease